MWLGYRNVIIKATIDRGFTTIPERQESDSWSRNSISFFYLVQRIWNHTFNYHKIYSAMFSLSPVTYKTKTRKNTEHCGVVSQSIAWIGLPWWLSNVFNRQHFPTILLSDWLIAEIKKYTENMEISEALSKSVNNITLFHQGRRWFCFNSAKRQNFGVQGQHSHFNCFRRCVYIFLNPHSFKTTKHPMKILCRI